MITERYEETVNLQGVISYQTDHLTSILLSLDQILAKYSGYHQTSIDSKFFYIQPTIQGNLQSIASSYQFDAKHDSAESANAFAADYNQRVKPIIRALLGDTSQLEAMSRHTIIETIE